MKKHIITHEKVIIVALAYIIGFTTAFIGFGLGDKVGKHHSYKQHHSKENKKEYRNNVSPDNKFNAVENQVSAEMTEEGFFARINGVERILSANVAAAVEIADPGYHHAVPEYHVSPNASFIYYCEQRTENPTDCYSYIYDVTSDTVHSVNAVNDAQQALQTGETAVWLSDNRLVVNGHVSIDSVTPWKVSGME